MGKPLEPGCDTHTTRRDRRTERAVEKDRASFPLSMQDGLVEKDKLNWELNMQYGCVEMDVRG